MRAPTTYCIAEIPVFNWRRAIQRQFYNWKSGGGMPPRKALFLEKGFEGGARIVSALRAGRGLAFQRYARFEEIALVPGVLFGDTRGDGLITLKTRGRVEMNALLATVQLKSAMRAPASEIHIGGQYLAAASATRDLVRRRKSGCFGSKYIRLRGRSLLRARARRILIAALPVFSFHRGRSEGRIP